MITNKISFYGCRLWIAIYLLTVTYAVGYAATINFEESIPQPDTVVNQYCNDPSTNKGVSFTSVGKIFTPTVSTSSPTHALFNDFGQEFDETGTLDISFTAGQSSVAMKVGVDRATNFPVTAVLSAYSSTTAGTGFITKSDDVDLGKGPVPITNDISVNSAAGNIRSVRLEFGGPSPSHFAYEVIDDLTFSTVGPTCLIDNADPTVQITKPASDNQKVYPNAELAFEAQDAESGIAKTQVLFLNAQGGTIESFYPCGGTSGPPCGLPGNTINYDFWTYIPDNTKTIRVKAWDYTGRGGQTDRLIDFRPLGPNMNLYAMAMEITQGIQNWVPGSIYTRLTGTPDTFNYPAAPTAIPLVAGRTTVVRLYAGVEGIGSDKQVDNVSAVLRCYTDSSFTNLHPGINSVNSANGSITLRPTDTFNSLRDDLNHTFRFVLPAAWTTAKTIYLEAEVKGPGIPEECTGCVDAANRIRISKITFNTVPSFNNSLFHLIAASFQDSTGTTQQPSQTRITNVINYLRRVFPVDESTVPNTVNANWTFVDDTSLDNEPRCDRVNGLLAGSFPNKGGKLVACGLVPVTFFCSGRGGGSKDNGGYCYARLNVPDTAAEEIGHSIGLDHAGPPPGHGAECPPCDSDWPWPHGTIGHYGFDIMNMTVIVPGTKETDLHDFMSYGGPNLWVSPRTWIRFYNAFAKANLPYPTSTLNVSSLAGSMAWLQDEPVRYQGEELHLLIRGEFDESLGWTLFPIYEVPLVKDPYLSMDEGEYQIDLLGSEGQLLFTQRFSVDTAHIDMDDPNVMLISPPTFQEAVPWHSEGKTIVLRGIEGKELARRTRSPNTPIVEILSPTRDGFLGQPDEPVINWRASDVDQEERFYYMIQYSPNGETTQTSWRTLAMDLTGNQLQVALNTLEGSSSARVRVLASDGFNTGMANSPAFYVPNNPPSVSIFLPPDGSTIYEGEPLDMRGTGSDLEDGLLPTEELSWLSSQDGLLGTGCSLHVESLTAGVHEIELIGFDSEGLGDAAVIVIEVLPRINSQPIAKAGSDFTASLLDPMQLDGANSIDPDGDSLIYDWSILNAPQGSNPQLSNPDSIVSQLLADYEGTYKIQLIVHDGEVASIPDTVYVFATSCIFVVDDFEDYNDYEFNRIFDTWIGGWDDPRNGATVGYPDADPYTGEHFVETNIVHSGAQSMPYFYDNSAGYSEATMPLSFSRDWTGENIEVLSLWFHGSPDNSIELMYVAVEDCDRNVGVVYHDDPGVTQIDTWTEWNIDLQAFANQGVNLADVNIISIGFGDRNNPQPNGQGKVYFDDIRLCPPE